MRIERLSRAAAVVAVGALLAGTLTAPAHAQRWTNHIDASMINEIVLRDQSLYVATFGGLLLYDLNDGTFDQYRNDTGLPSNSIRCLAFDDDGDIYAGTTDVGMAKIRVANGKLTLLRSLSQQIDGLASNTINSVALWGDVIVYGSSPGAGTIRNDFASARYFERDGLPAPDVVDVLPLGDVVYMATAAGMARLDLLGIIQTVVGTPVDGLGNPIPVNVLGTDGTDVWVGTNQGVRRYSPGAGTWTDLGPPAAVGTQGRLIHSFFWTGDTMWAGTRRSYMWYPGSGTTWTTMRADSVQNRYQLGNLEMRGLVVTPDDDVYVGSASPTDFRGTNLMRFDGTNLVNLKPNAPGANNVLRLSLDTDGSLWGSFFSYYVGKLMPDGNWVNYNPSVPGIQFPSNAFTNIGFLADSQGHKWFSSLTDPNDPPNEYRPLDELDDRLDANYSNDVWVRHALGSGGGETYGSLRPQRAAEDPAGNRWFMSDAEENAVPLGWQGINILSRDGSAWFQMTPTKEPRMINGNVVDVAFGSNYTYVAFKNQGVYRWRHGGYDWTNLTTYATDSWTPWVTTTQLPAGTAITRLAITDNDRLWIGSTEGLFYTDGGLLGTVPPYVGITPGIVSPNVRDIILDHDENMWVATDLGLNRVAEDDYNDIQTFLTPASFLLLSGLRYPLEVISPLANADCRSLAMHPTRDMLYIGTLGGISVYDFSAPAPTPTDLSTVYVYPNPIYTGKGHASLKIANLTGPVLVEIYTIEGELVDERTVSVDGDVAWDLLTRGGLGASSGKYIVRIVGENGSVQRPIALIR